MKSQQGSALTGAPVPTKAQAEALASGLDRESGEIYGMPSRSIATMKEAGWIELRNVIPPKKQAEALGMRDGFIESARECIGGNWQAARDYLRLATDYEGASKRMKWCLTEAGRAIAEGGKP